MRRVAAETVPFLLGASAGWLLGALAGTWPGVLLGAAAWLAASALLRAVRARPALRRSYRLALAAHVVWWGWAGWQESAPRSRAAPVLAERTSWGAASAFRAGAAEVPVALPADVPLAGWGGRLRRTGLPAFGGLGTLGRLSQASLAFQREGAPLRALFVRALGADPRAPAAPRAKALVLVPTGPDAPLERRAPLALVRLDLLTGDAHLSAAVLEGVADLGFTPSSLLLTATHTHSSVGGYARDPAVQVLATDHHDPVIFAALVTACVRSVREAHAAARPARLRLSEGRDRGPDGLSILAVRRGRERDRLPAEDRVGLLRVEVDDGRLLALVVSHAVHPVALRASHPALDGDLVAAVESALSARLPGRPAVLFVQSGLGDASPRPVRRPEAPFAVERAAQQFAQALLPELEGGTAYDRLSVSTARALRDLGSPRALVSLGDREALVEDVGERPFSGALPGLLGDGLLLPANALLWSLTLTELRLGGTARGGLGLWANLERGLLSREQALGVVRLSLARSAGGPALPWSLAWVPGEPSQDLAEEWRRSLAEEGGARPWVIALCNGSMGYAVTQAAYRQGGYEATATLFGPNTGALLTEALATAHEALVTR